MKKSLFLMMIAAAAIAVCSCDKSEENNGDNNGNGNNNGAGSALAIDKTAIDASAAAGIHAVAVTSSGTWSAAVNSVAAVWCMFSPASATGNGTLNVNVTENTATASRAATVTVASGTLTRTVSVTQAGDNSALRFDRATVAASYTAGTYAVNVTSTQAWAAEVDAAATWCTISPNNYAGNYAVTVSVRENAMALERAATITFTAGTLTRAVVVIQAGAPVTLTVNKTDVDALCSARSYTIVVASNAAWTTTVSSDATWCTLTSASATGNGTVTVNIAANPATTVTRAATITVAASTVSKTVSVMQDAFPYVIHETDDAPTYAASKKVWIIGSQTWSDAIRVVNGCPEFKASSNSPQCGQVGGDYYYNFTYIKNNQSSLCPAPWRVPNRADLESVKPYARSNDLYNSWGQNYVATGGTWVIYADKYYSMWAGYENSLSLVWYLRLIRDGQPDVTYDPYGPDRGFMVRCVK
jgi:hypothetical protein